MVTKSSSKVLHHTFKNNFVMMKSGLLFALAFFLLLSKTGSANSRLKVNDSVSYTIEQIVALEQTTDGLSSKLEYMMSYRLEVKVTGIDNQKNLLLTLSVNDCVVNLKNSPSHTINGNLFNKPLQISLSPKGIATITDSYSIRTFEVLLRKEEFNALLLNFGKPAMDAIIAKIFVPFKPDSKTTYNTKNVLGTFFTAESTATKIKGSNSYTVAIDGNCPEQACIYPLGEATYKTKVEGKCNGNIIIASGFPQSGTMETSLKSPETWIAGKFHITELFRFKQ
jgi:hypothetical protein